MKLTTDTISAAAPSRPIGVQLAAAEVSVSALMSVTIQPGATALTRTPRGAPQLLHEKGRGIADTKSPFADLFQHRTTNRAPQRPPLQTEQSGTAALGFVNTDRDQTVFGMYDEMPVPGRSGVRDIARGCE